MSTGPLSVGPLTRWAARAGGGWLAPAGARGRLAILIYHRVLPQADPVFGDEVDQARFEWHMALLARCFNVLELEEAVRRLQSGKLPPRAACITFDDGYRDNHDVALPVLKKWSLPATFFVATGYLDGGCMWNDAIRETIRQVSGPELDLTALGYGRLAISDVNARRRAARSLIMQLKYLGSPRREEAVARIAEAAGARIPDDLMMRSTQVRSLHDAGMTIGAHTATHPILARIGIEDARREIGSGKETLERIVGRPIKLFAYPNGVPGVDYTGEHVDLVRALGFTAAVSTAWGVACRGASLFELPRFTPWDKTPGRFTARLLHNYLRVKPAVAHVQMATVAT